MIASKIYGIAPEYIFLNSNKQKQQSRQRWLVVWQMNHSLFKSLMNYKLLNESHGMTYFSNSVLNVLPIKHLPGNQQSLSILAENIQAVAIGVERLYMLDLYASLLPFAMMAPVILAIE